MSGTLVPVTSNAPPVERLHNGKPIVQRIESHPWENKVTFNPACILVDDAPTLGKIIPRLPFDAATTSALLSHTALCFLLYRAQGRKTETYDHRRSCIGLAVLTPDLRLLARHTEPVIVPDQEYEDLGVEDGRLARFGDRFVLLYTAYNTGTPRNRVRIALASTLDFVHWQKHGLLRGDFNTLDNKNAMLFPEKVNGRSLMLHRPMEGPDALAIHLAEGDGIFDRWTGKGPLMKPVKTPGFVDTWIGGGAPPLRLPDGRFLVIYHIGNKRSDESRVYKLAIALADPSVKGLIVRRDEPLLQPETDAETTGDSELGVNNVVFICGAYFYGGDVYFPYAGADSVVLAGRIAKSDLEHYLRG